MRFFFRGERKSGEGNEQRGRSFFFREKWAVAKIFFWEEKLEWVLGFLFIYLFLWQVRDFKRNKKKRGELKRERSGMRRRPCSTVGGAAAATTGAEEQTILLMSALTMPVKVQVKKVMIGGG